jgi:hypothetical protein
MRAGITLLVLGLCGVASCGSCQPPPPPPNACASISVPAVNGPGSGVQTICTAPTDCREDTMTTLIDALLCNDKSGAYCVAGTPTCSGKCAGTVVSSGLTATACTWDRNSECKTAAGGDGSNCTCTWTIPAGSSLACGCGCQ